MGDRVWLQNKRRRKGLSPKLAAKWLGPYQVTRVISDWLYQVQKGDGKLQVVHHNRLKPDMGCNPNAEPDIQEFNESVPPQTDVGTDEAGYVTNDHVDDLIVTSVEEETAPPPSLPYINRFKRTIRKPARYYD